MPDILVRKVDAKILVKLKARARQNQRSLQGELTEVFRSIANETTLSDKATAERIKESLRRTGRSFSDSADILREDRDR
ncbi:MAG: hypothetical protein KF756_04075 [Acidobacteria bacterium]|nr:hypothetical protein [Acidobacteriota bacterium]